MDKNSLQLQIDAITSAPALYLAALAAVAAFVWWITGTRYTDQIATLRERITLTENQRDDYKNKLNGATPDEAKARLEKLEAAVASLAPRKLLPDQEAALKRAIAASAGTIEIAHDMSCADCNSYANFLRRAFQDMSWKVIAPAIMGPGVAPKSGIGVGIARVEAPTEKEQAVVRALTAAGVSFDVVKRLPNARPEPDQSDVSILITTAQR